MRRTFRQSVWSNSANLLFDVLKHCRPQVLLSIFFLASTYQCVLWFVYFWLIKPQVMFYFWLKVQGEKYLQFSWFRNLVTLNSYFMLFLCLRNTPLSTASCRYNCRYQGWRLELKLGFHYQTFNLRAIALNIHHHHHQPSPKLMKCFWRHQFRKFFPIIDPFRN